MNPEPFDINLLNSGGVVADLHAVVQAAFDDICDPNKPATKTRKVTLTLEFIPSEDRASAPVKATVKPSFPADSPRVDIVQIQLHTKRGFVTRAEQLPLGYDPVTGEVDEVSPFIRKDGSND